MTVEVPEFGSQEFIDALRECVQQSQFGGIGGDDHEAAACRQLINKLATTAEDGEELVTYAANTSYAYWYLSTIATSSSSESEEPFVTEEDKVMSAMKEARRHIAGSNGDVDKALNSLIESCRYRKEMKIDLLRTCFDPAHVYLDADDEQKAKEMAALVRFDLEKQYHVLRGHDGSGRCVMIKYPRTEDGAEEKSYMLANIYMGERSTAATEFMTRGRQERSVAVYNYIGFDRSMSPPFQLQVSAAVQMQKSFPERLQTLVMVEPPFWLKGVMSLLSPFLADSISERIKMATGIDERHTVFSEQIKLSRDQSTTLMRKDGQLTTPVSLDHFLVDLPFCYVYDSIPCKREITPAEEELHNVAHTMPEEGPSIATQASSLWSSVASSFSSFGADDEKK